MKGLLMDIKQLQKLIRESLKQIDSSNLIVQAGTELFHSTIEEFEKDKAHPGGYDNVFWTTDSSLISQTYIPVSGSHYYTSSESIAMPNDNPFIQNTQRQFGINYDYSEVEWGPGKRAVSYKSAPVFEKINNEYYKIAEQFRESDIKLKALTQKIKDQKYDTSDEELEELGNLEAENEELKKKYYAFKPEKFRNAYVNEKLKALGYEPTGEDRVNNNSHWKLKYDNNQLQPADYRAQGRLLIVVPKRDLKIYDTTMGGAREGDLTDLDYHKHNWFQLAMDNGYDGIQINDFAQSDDQGNFGHRSIGLFKHALKDVEIHEIPAQHRDIGNVYREKNDWHSPEYHNFKTKIQEAVRKSIMAENVIAPPNIPGTMNFFHGGNLDAYDDLIAQKNGRYEYGPGLYIIQDYNTASRYSKGGRKFYIVTVSHGTDINDVSLPVEKIQDFMKLYVMASKRKLMWERLQRHVRDGQIDVYLLNNFLINEKALKPSNTPALRQFYIDNGIDYEIIDNAFGTGRKMMVLYNMNKIVNVIRIQSGDRLSTYEL